MSFDKCLALIFSLMILGQAYLVRRCVGTWLFPACLFGLFWFGFTFFPLAILFWMPIHPYAIGFIFLCTLAFSLGSVLFDWKTAFKINAQKRDTAALVYGSSFLKAVFYVSAVGSLLFLVLNLLAQGISFRDVFFDLSGSAATYLNLIYSESLNGTIFERLTTVCAYLGAILGGIVLSSIATKNGRRLVVLFSFLPSVLAAVALSYKGLLFLCAIFFYAGLLVYRLSVGGLHLFERMSVRSVALCGVAVTAIIATSFASRGVFDTDDRAVVADKLVGYFASYSCGHIYAFSDWFSFTTGGPSELTYAHEGAGLGFYTFAPIFRVMGSHKIMPQGVYDDYYYDGLLSGNIFTMFRGLIQDFGLIGCVLFMLTTGLLLHWTFQVMLRKRTPVFTVAAFVLSMGCFYISFIVSPLLWSNIYVAFVLLWVVLQLNCRITMKAGQLLALAALTGETP